MSANESSVETRGYTYEVDPDRSISEAVVTAVAEASGRRTAPGPGSARRDSVDALDPLYHAIDPDALESLFSSRRTERTGDVEVSFFYHDCLVTVHSYGIIRVEPSEEAATR